MGYRAVHVLPLRHRGATIGALNQWSPLLRTNEVADA